MGHTETGTGLHGTTSGIHRLLETATQEMPDGQRVVGSIVQPVERAEPKRTLGPIDCTLRLTGVRQRHATQEEREGGRGAQRECLLKGGKGGGAVMLHHCYGRGAKGESSRVVATMADGSAGVVDCRHAVCGTVPAMRKKDLVAPGDKAVGAGILGLKRQRFLEQR